MAGLETSSTAGKRKRRAPLGLRLAAFVLVPAAFVGFLGYGLFTTRPPKAVVGQQAPSFALPELGGTKTISAADLEGAPVVVNFWASWCVPCREEAPDLERMWQRYRRDGVQFLGVNIKDTEEDAKAFVREFRITYPSVRDVDQEVTLKFGVAGVPETFFVDHRWRFVSIGRGPQIGTQGGTAVRGAISPALLRSRVEFLLSLWEQEKVTREGRR